MAEEKVYTPEVITENPFPNSEAYTSSETNSSGGTSTPTTTKPQNMPKKVVAVELIGSVLNTKSKKILAEVQFTPSGALQIGKYQSGVSGDLRISPVGILARNTSGNTTFALDGDTGDATFLGTVQAGSAIFATISASKITTGTLQATETIDIGSPGSGKYLRLDGVNARIIGHDGTNPRIVIEV